MGVGQPAEPVESYTTVQRSKVACINVAVRLFRDKSHMTSKCGMNKKSGTPGECKCVTELCSFHILNFL